MLLLLFRSIRWWRRWN